MMFRAWREKRKKDFQRRHPGAVRKYAEIGQGGFYYTAYCESNLAAMLELCSILTVVVMAGVAVIYLREHPPENMWIAVLCVPAVFCTGIPFRWLARTANYAIVRNRIRTDTDYAYYFAWKYPDQKALCTELNMQYAAYPDAVPEQVFLEKEARQKQKDEPFRRIILFAGFGLLTALAVGFVLFCLWVKHETE